MTDPYENERNYINSLSGSRSEVTQSAQSLRIDKIVQGFRSGVISPTAAKYLLANPSVSVEGYMSTHKYRFKPDNTGLLALPWAFIFENYKSIKSPVFFGKKPKAKARQKIILPVTPEEVSISSPSSPSSFSTIGGLTHTHAGPVEPKKISFESFIPVLDDPRNMPSYVGGFIKKSGIYKPYQLVEKFTEAQQANQPIKFTVCRIDSKGAFIAKHLGPLNVTVTNFDYSYKHGHDADLFYSMELTEWFPQRFAIGGLVNQEGEIKYRVVRADTIHPDSERFINRATLIKVARKKLGTGKRWKEIYKLNKKRIDKLKNTPIPVNFLLIVPRR